MLEGFVKLPILSGSSFVSVTSNEINFNGNVVFHMKKAEYVSLLLNSKEKKIAIQKCDKDDEDKIQFFREGTNWKNGVRFNNRDIQQMIAMMMGWDLEKFNYRADGIYVDDEHAMVFDLNTARKFLKKNR